jgi:hypothetical protein
MGRSSLRFKRRRDFRAERLAQSPPRQRRTGCPGGHAVQSGKGHEQVISRPWPHACLQQLMKRPIDRQRLPERFPLQTLSHHIGTGLAHSTALHTTTQIRETTTSNVESHRDANRITAVGIHRTASTVDARENSLKTWALGSSKHQI